MSVFLRMHAFVFLFLSIATTSLTATELSCPSYVAESIYEELKPYFLPDQHPAKKKLDILFSSPNVLNNSDTLQKAGFKVTGVKGYSKVVVLKHKKLKNYLIKAFTDDQEDFVDWVAWLRRIEGSLIVRSVIEKNNFQDFFKVPQKWIYQLSRDEHSEKHFVLVVEDMNIFDRRGNAIRWRSVEHVTKEKLNALHRVMYEAGLKDSVYISNIPFSLDDKIAFVDTEHFHRWPITFDRLTPFLSKKMQDYWMNLIQRNL